MKLLVTGGTGYIGSHTVKALIKAGHTVFVFDSLEKSSKARLHGMIPDEAIIQGNLLNPSDLKAVFASQSFDAVIHFAAYIEAGESVKEPGRFFWNNTAGTINLLNAMHDHNVNHLVFSSTAAVYGEPNEIPIKETASTQPTNPYGSSKLLVEEVLTDLTRLTSLQATILRYFNACGADPDGQLGENHNPETHLIPLILQVASGEREQIKLFGTDYSTPDGTAVRDYIHVTDLANAHVKALEAQFSDANSKLATYNVGSGQGYSVKEVLEACRKETNHPIPATEEPRRPGDPAQLVAEATKITTELGWEPCYSDLPTIIKTAWAWHQKSH